MALEDSLQSESSGNSVCSASSDIRPEYTSPPNQLGLELSSLQKQGADHREQPPGCDVQGLVALEDSLQPELSVNAVYFDYSDISNSDTNPHRGTGEVGEVAVSSRSVCGTWR